MNHLIKRALQAGILVGGLWVIGQGIASADTVQAPASAPATVCGNSVGLFSDPSASCPADSSGSTSTSSDGSTVNAPASTPVNVTGNSVVIGQPTGTGTTGTGSTDPGTSTGTGSGTGSTSTGTGILGTGLLAGSGLLNSDALDSTSANAPVTAPATVCGNSVGVGSDPSSGCPAGTASSTSGTGSQSSGTSGTTGTSATAPITAPATVCGNGVGVFGGGGASCGAVQAATVTNPVTPTRPTLPTLPVTTGTTGRSPVATLFSDAAQSLASTGSDVQSVLAIAMGLLYTGVTMALATVKRTVNEVSSTVPTDLVPALS